MRKKFIAGNWKMYTTLNGARDLAAAVTKGVTDDKVTVAVCPPFPWLVPVAEVLKGTKVGLGAQNCHYAEEGACTGDVAPKMLIEAGCQYVIIGHSERRHGIAEPELFLNRKVKAALKAGLSVIFCVGELLAEREAKQTEEVLAFQLAAGLSGVPSNMLGKLVIAYEPVWAIGTGKVATPVQAQEGVCVSSEGIRQALRRGSGPIASNTVRRQREAGQRGGDPQTARRGRGPCRRREPQGRLVPGDCQRRKIGLPLAAWPRLGVGLQPLARIPL